MGREGRRVSADWEHPRNTNGHLVPLLDGAFLAVNQADWDTEREKWPGDTASFIEWEGARPVEADYMPCWPEECRTHYQMYETVSEGTPISPVLPSPEALAVWLVEHKANAGGGRTATYQQWLRVCNGGYAPSMVCVPGIGMIAGVEMPVNESDSE